jgi:Protein of unknown function (DUF3684)
MDPPMTECVNRLLARPPQSRREAATLFGYFASRLGELGQNSVAKIADARIVPVISKNQVANSYVNEKAADHGDLRHLTPHQCYLGSSSTYSDIFEFVDFGVEANAFLQKCGSKNEPTKLELATLACKEPARLLGIMQSPEKYLNLLRTLADELPMLKRDKVLFKQMRQSKFLLGSVEIPGNKESVKSRASNVLQLADAGYDSEPEDIEDAPIKQFQLAMPSQIVVVSFFLDIFFVSLLTFCRMTIIPDTGCLGSLSSVRRKRTNWRLSISHWVPRPLGA